MTISARDARIIEKVKDTDEPIIVFRGQDRHAVGMLRDYLTRLWSDSEVKDEMKDAVTDKAKEFMEWQDKNHAKVKTPDLGEESHLRPGAIQVMDTTPDTE